MTSFPREEPAVSVSSSACAVNEKEPVKNIKVNGIVLIPMAIWSPDGRWSIKNGIIWMRMVLEQLVGS